MSFKHGRATKEFQDFFTKKSTARQLFKLMRPEMEAKQKELGRPLQLLEPAVGSGNLIWPMLKSGIPMEVACMDIQRDYLEYVVKKAKKKGYRVTLLEHGIKVSNA